MKSWPVNYKLPLYAMPRNVLAVLDEGGMLGTEPLRSALLGALYQDVTRTLCEYEQQH